MPILFKRARAVAASIVLGVLPLVAQGTAGAQESTTYRMDRVTVAASAARASSPTYEISLTFGEEGPAGSASRCNDGFLQTTGFWSILGERPIPIVLEVRRAAGDPEEVDLSWSGAADFFDIYRSEEREGVKSGPHLAQTVPSCSTSDSPPLVPGIIYYLVIPAGS